MFVSCWRQEDCIGHDWGVFVGRGGRRRGADFLAQQRLDGGAMTDIGTRGEE